MDATNHTASAQRGRWAVAAMFFINGFIIGSWSAQIPAYIMRLDISEATFGLLILSFGLGAVSSMPCAGLIMARAGSRPVVLPLAFLAVFGLPLVTLAPGVFAWSSMCRRAA